MQLNRSFFFAFTMLCLIDLRIPCTICVHCSAKHCNTIDCLIFEEENSNFKFFIEMTGIIVSWEGHLTDIHTCSEKIYLKKYTSCLWCDCWRVCFVRLLPLWEQKCTWSTNSALRQIFCHNYRSVFFSPAVLMSLQSHFVSCKNTKGSKYRAAFSNCMFGYKWRMQRRMPCRGGPPASGVDLFSWRRS